MKTLVVFDNTGRIYYQAEGDVAEPQGGLQFLWVDVPEGKYLTGIDVSGKTPQAILKDVPKSETAMLSEKVNALSVALANIMGV